MVQIIVNEDENSNGLVNGKLDEIQKEVKGIRNGVDSLDKEMDLWVTVIGDIDKNVDSISDVLNKQHILFNKRFNELDKKLEEIMKKLSLNTTTNQKSGQTKQVQKGTEKPAQVAHNSKKPVRKINKRKGNDERFEPAEYSKTLWRKLKLLDNGEIIDTGRASYKLPVDVYDLLYIIECNEIGLSYGDFRRLYKDFESNNNTMGKIIYNIREHSFDKILHKYYESIKKVKFELEDGYLKVNGEKTKVTKSKANEWIQLMFNSNRKQKTILNIKNTNKTFSKTLIHVICDNYDNNGLLDIIKPDEKGEFIENNPSRRRNLIRNGGIL